MNQHALWHTPDSPYAHALTESRIVLRLRAAKGDLIRCVLFYGDRVDPEPRVRMTALELVLVASDRLFDYFEADFETHICRICYYFWISDGREDYFYCSGEFTHKLSANRTEYFQFPYVRREDIALVPAWAREAVIYQIFPDSFASSRRAITGLGGHQFTELGERSETRLGGTLKGILDNVDYLQQLGINCLYLNPLFTAGAYHKYDTIDYLTIDPCFGTLQDLKDLVKACHALGIRVILDGVFNHCGWRFFAFRDAVEKGEQSAYKDWFYKLEFPVDTEKLNYAAFAYVRQMPKLNTGNPEVVRYFCEVGRYWIREAGIDGWRLDVANEVDHDFWRAFRKSVREEKPDVFLIGEIWEDAHQWLLGDQFDSAMNYRFTDLCKGFFAAGDMSVDDFDASLGYMNMRYKKQITPLQMNMLDSHDVPRFLSLCGGNLAKFRLAVLFLMTYLGIPSILYGDEKAIKGLHEADYRSPMIWEDDAAASDLTAYYQKLIAIRRAHVDIFAGGVKTVLKDSAKGLYAFSRYHGDEEMLIVLNNSPREQILLIPENYEGYQDLLTGVTVLKNSNGSGLSLRAYQGLVLARETSGSMQWD